MKKLQTIFGILSGALSLVLTIGVKNFFSACDHMTDTGAYMSCHWAEQAVFAISLVLCVTSVAMVLMRDPKMRSGLAMAMVPQAVITMLIPNVFINLCMKTDMQCHSVMRPAVMLLCGGIAVCAAIAAFLGIKAKEKA